MPKFRSSPDKNKVRGVPRVQHLTAWRPNGSSLPDMPRYLFHFEGQQPRTDTTGEALPDDGAAWREAVGLSRDVEHALRPGDSWTLSVFDCREH